MVRVPYKDCEMNKTAVANSIETPAAIPNSPCSQNRSLAMGPRIEEEYVLHVFLEDVAAKDQFLVVVFRVGNRRVSACLAIAYFVGNDGLCVCWTSCAGPRPTVPRRISSSS